MEADSLDLKADCHSKLLVSLGNLLKLADLHLIFFLFKEGLILVPALLGLLWD